MIGTCFLFLYWPSFNAAMGTFASAQHRAIINTLLANSTSVISACLFSRIAKGGKLDMIIIVNATLAGGAAMGASADLINYPFCSMIVGFVAGGLAAIGFAYG
jgi:ammonium transporter Rh